jgi:hypothetical protein
MNYVNNDISSPVLAIAFSGVDKLTEYLTSNKVDLLLISEHIDIEAGTNQITRELIGDIKILYLTDEKASHTTCGKEQECICKYTKAGNILNKIVDILTYTDNRFRKNLYRTYAVTSPIGRCGKTRTAMAICQADEVRGGLYIGMEPYGYMASLKAPYTMSDILYLAKIRSEQILEYIEAGIIKLDDLSFISSPKGCTDLKECDKEDIEWLLDKIADWGVFTTVVWDIDGAALSDINILGIFDKVVVPVLRDDISLQKLENFKNLLREKELTKLAQGLVEIEVPDREYNDTEMVRYIGRMLENENK